MKSVRVFAIAAALSTMTLAAARPASAQAACNPGVGAGFALHPTTYTALVNALGPQVNALRTQLAAVVDQTTYATLLTTARTLANSIATGRVVVTLPDGTVAVDTSKTDDPGNTMATGNSFQHFSNKTVNENHNSRVAIFDAQEWPCGIGLETKLSTTTGQHEVYLAVRLGAQFDAIGTARISVTE
ncbi:MAG TPA: hypothetical protein VH417_09595 [Vicinamibacterales bacterium]|jgi:hypothetical protein